MTDLGKGLEKWMDQVEDAMKLSIEDKSKITGAGAEVYAKKLQDNTPVSTAEYKTARSAGHGRKTKHLRDSITYKEGYTSDNVHTGSTSVGFDSPYQAMVARFVNNGVQNMSAKQIKNMHFKDRTDEEAKDAVFEAEAKKYKEITGL